ncbi:hypothetical protein HBI42_105790 [Parastagonospora nodorum]|nr:hypothetical protein HBI43_103510 [Parastagonospora nodorum]KAH6258100.1 hypothetical protein HBI42_105790 [Parastagonospora nodorum]
MNQECTSNLTSIIARLSHNPCSACSRPHDLQNPLHTAPRFVTSPHMTPPDPFFHSSLTPPSPPAKSSRLTADRTQPSARMKQGQPLPPMRPCGLRNLPIIARPFQTDDCSGHGFGWAASLCILSLRM